MSSSLPTDEALEKECRIDEIKKKKKKIYIYIYIYIYSPPVLYLLQTQQARHWTLPSTIARPNHPQLSLLPFFFVCYRRRLFIRSNLISSRWIWLEFKLIQYFMRVLVICKFDDDPIKNTDAIVSKAFLPVFKGR